MPRCAGLRKTKRDVSPRSYRTASDTLRLSFRRSPAGRRAGQDAAGAQQGAREHPETTADPGGRPDPGNRGER